MDPSFCSQDLEQGVSLALWNRNVFAVPVKILPLQAELVGSGQFCLWSTVTRVFRALQLKTAETNWDWNGVGKRLSLSGQSDLEASRLKRKVEEERLVWRRTILIMTLLMCDCSDLNELLMLLLHNLYASMARGVQCKSCLMKRWICACRCLKFWAFLQDAEEKPHHRQKAYGWAFH